MEIINNAYDKDIANAIMDSYKEIENNFILEKWKPSELDAGHFVETVRRIIEYELFKKYTPFDQKLSLFNDSVLRDYERSNGDESFRILIPRILKAIYNIRNKRGVGHAGKIKPNEMDSTFILYSVKWILAEIIRLKSKLSIEETQSIVNNIISRKIDLIWKGDGFIRILKNELKTDEKVLILLFENSPIDKKELQKSIDYKNSSDFKKILIRLHNEVLINFDGVNCTISPKGTIAAEKIIIDSKQ